MISKFNKISITLFLSSIMCIILFSSCQHNKNPRQQVGFAGDDLSQSVKITRDKNTKATLIEFNTTGKWEVFTGLSSNDIDLSSPILEGAGSGKFPLKVSDTTRNYFQVVTAYGKAIMAERQLPMAGGYNFRDLGGMKTTNGKYVKWGKLFRADDLNKLTKEDLDYLSSIPLHSIVDFRDVEEAQQAPDKRPTSLKNYYPLPIAPGNLGQDIMNLPDIKNMKASEGEAIMAKMYKIIVTDSICIEQYKKLFALLVDENNLPLLYHCAAGKDRTGLATAFILSALGVDKETIMEDYIASNKYLEDKYSRHKDTSPFLKSLFEIKKQYLESAWEQIENDHGSMEIFLQNVLGVNIEKMRDLYLY